MIDHASPKAPRPSDHMRPAHGRLERLLDGARDDVEAASGQASAFDSDERREREQGRERVLDLGAPVPVDEVGAHAERAGALDVVLEGIADHHRGLGRDARARRGRP